MSLSSRTDSGDPESVRADHQGYGRISSVSRILPLQNFTDICRRVYFAVDYYNEIDFILANGYLHIIFTQHFIGSGLNNYQRHGQLCWENMERAVSQLPLLLPASMETIAALVLGV